MKKTTSSKIRLNRETLRRIAGEDLGRVGGGLTGNCSGSVGYSCEPRCESIINCESAAHGSCVIRGI